ncbi:hypothetical protein DAPPUDRAFT_322349 [Daphnia pulex]|uniref:Uncharacterized protein n=1 Tax=Daphnia pulex TaxID=6669 RepID=E9GVN4_DAPPU|nr:hypothetical protein DAPPUDRAFT_322349 [Daphnia pulex]|eukprot:EFX76499.1 hypothetical protein DAPPUDRAFT_322349 [Daphnia pulex]
MMETEDVATNRHRGMKIVLDFGKRVWKKLHQRWFTTVSTSNEKHAINFQLNHYRTRRALSKRLKFRLRCGTSPPVIRAITNQLPIPDGCTPVATSIMEENAEEYQLTPS